MEETCLHSLGKLKKLKLSRCFDEEVRIFVPSPSFLSYFSFQN